MNTGKDNQAADWDGHQTTLDPAPTTALRGQDAVAHGSRAVRSAPRAEWASPAPYGVHVEVVDGDLLDQPDAAVIFNPWNRNFIRPRWLLLARGVSGQLKKRTGPGPWRELAQHGLLPLGAAVATGAGQWRPDVHLVHVAGLRKRWRATDAAVQACTVNALDVTWSLGARVAATPLIGAHHGLTHEQSLQAILSAAEHYRPPRAGLPTVVLRIVRWSK